jgi:TPP-dependent indolepyruvate ferredoxin oxidoreductase alpha subunit
MKRKISKILSLVIALTLCIPIFSQQIYAQSVLNVNQYAKAIKSKNSKENIKYLIGKPGDTHFVYTYEQNGINYKVVDDANTDFTQINSTIYVLNSMGNYVEDSIQKFFKKSNTEAVIIFKEKNEIEKNVLYQLAQNYLTYNHKLKKI